MAQQQHLQAMDMPMPMVRVAVAVEVLVQMGLVDPELDQVLVKDMVRVA